MSIYMGNWETLAHVCRLLGTNFLIFSTSDFKFIVDWRGTLTAWRRRVDAPFNFVSGGGAKFSQKNPVGGAHLYCKLQGTKLTKRKSVKDGSACLVHSTFSFSVCCWLTEWARAGVIWMPRKPYVLFCPKQFTEQQASESNTKNYDYSGIIKTMECTFT